MCQTLLNLIPILEHKNPKILKLSLKSSPFEVMVSGEKKYEFRNPSDWILSRLYNKDGSLKLYDQIEFTNGYGSKRPSFICYYKGFTTLTHGIHTEPYSNGFHIGFLPSGTIKIELGDIISIKNSL